MSIHDGIINKFSAQYVVNLPGDQTLNHAIQALQKNKYPEKQTYLVVAQSAEQYRVANFFPDMEELVKKMGPECLAQPLASLPLPPAMRVERRDTSESGKSIGDWVTSTPDATLVVTDDSGFVALLVNTHLGGGLFSKISFLGLHGEGSDLAKDYRKAVDPLVDPDICPHCEKATFFEYDKERGSYVCPLCGGIEP